jgi:hypothetical protein
MGLIMDNKEKIILSDIDALVGKAMFRLMSSNATSIENEWPIELVEVAMLRMLSSVDAYMLGILNGAIKGRDVVLERVKFYNNNKGEVMKWQI